MNITSAITAESAGEGVFEALHRNNKAIVNGITSQGVFLLTSGQEIVFISYHHFRGPLTITLGETPEQLKNINLKMAAELSGDAITLPGIKIDIPEHALWQPSITKAIPDCQPERLERLKAICKKAFEMKEGAGFSVFLPFIIDMGMKLDGQSLPDKEKQIISILQNTSTKILSAEGDKIILELASILGYGRGLTPAADDCVVGLLLVLTRWPELFKTISPLPSLSDSLIRFAQDKTTTLSANIIKWASRGVADERLIKLVDWLLTGEGASYDECLDWVVNYGNSSGVDALVGMALLIR